MEQESPQQCLYVHSNVQFVVVPVLAQTALHTVCCLLKWFIVQLMLPISSALN